MKKMQMTLLILLLVTMLMTGCWLDPYQPPTGMASNEAVYVMNGGAGTISIIDIEEDTVYNEVALTGVCTQSNLLA